MGHREVWSRSAFSASAKFFLSRSKLLHTAWRFPRGRWEQREAVSARWARRLKLRTECTAFGAIGAAPRARALYLRSLSGGSAALMWIERLLSGVLRVLTPLGPRYLSPSFLERVYLLWTFRNFTSLPLVVLNHRQQKLVDRLCSQHKFVSLPFSAPSACVSVWEWMRDKCSEIGKLRRRECSKAELYPTSRYVRRSVSWTAAWLFGGRFRNAVQRR